MKIGILINSFRLGGAEKIMYDLAEEFYKQGILFTLISMKRPENELETQIFNNLVNKGYDIVSVNKPVGRGKLKAILSIKKIIKNHQIEVLHTNGQSPDFYGRLAKLLSWKTKIVVTIHSTQGYSRKIERLLSPLTSAYTAVSKQTAEYAVKDLNIQKKVSVIDNGIDFSRYNANNEKNNKGYTILSVGRVMQQKGYLDIAESMCEYLRTDKDALWHIIGDIEQDEDYVNAVKAKLSEDVVDRIKFHGTVTDTESYYKHAQVFLLASSFEGFGIAFIEAMAAKLPVICKEVGVILDINNAGGRVIDLKNRTIADCVNEAKKFKAEWLEFNYEYCKDNYSIESIAERYINTYKSCMLTNTE